MYVAGEDPAAIAAELHEPLADVVEFLNLTPLPASVDPPRVRAARKIDPQRLAQALRVPKRSPVVDGPKRRYYEPGSALGMHADMGGKVVG